MYIVNLTTNNCKLSYHGRQANQYSEITTIVANWKTLT